MLVNSFSNGSFLYPNLSSINSQSSVDTHCFIIRPSSYIYTSFNFTNIFILLPLYIFILYHGIRQQLQKKGSTSSAATSHSDSFTYHMVIMKLAGVFGSILSCFGIYMVNLSILGMGALLLYFTWYGEICFHSLTCVERYLAVVHPIAYLSLRNKRGVRIRNATVFCVWLLSFIGVGLVMIQSVSTVVDFCVLILSLSIMVFCSLSVLRVLSRPSPGKQDRDRMKVDKSKQRAFYTILIILGVLVLRFSWSLFRVLLMYAGERGGCVLISCEVWFNLPSNLVLPLLFLHRAEKLMCCKTNIQ